MLKHKSSIEVNPPPVIVQNLTEKADIYWGNGQTWLSGYTPPDVPPCGFSNEKCPPGETSFTTFVSEGQV